MGYMSVRQAAERWGISDQQIQILCSQNEISGAIMEGGTYLIPQDAEKPAYGRSQDQEGSNRFASLFQQIDALKEELDRKRPLTEGELRRLQDEFLVEYTYHSNAIEGNTLTLRETALVLEGITIDKKPLKDHLEAVGHRDAFLYVQELVQKRVPFSESVIKQIHTLVLMDQPQDRGVYRHIPVRILGAYHEPTDPILIPEQMSQLIGEFINRDQHPIENAALFHFKFEGIHPFVDGNGRTCRLILNLSLMQNGFPPVNVKYSDRRRYYDAFDSYYRDSDVGAMVTLIADYVKERLIFYNELVR